MFRLETLPQYIWDGEKERFQAFLSGRDDPSSESLQAWLRMLDGHRACGRSLTRVHVIPPVLTPYLSYEIGWGYPESAKAGEDTRFQVFSDYDSWLANVRVPDFWIFDDSSVVIMKYAEDGRYLKAELLLSPEHLPYFKMLRKDAWNDALSLEQVLRTIPPREE